MSLPATFPGGSVPRGDRAGPAFSCVLQANGAGPAWVRVAGELDITSAPQLERVLRDAEQSPHMVILDLRELSFLDTSGVHVILGAAVRARHANHWFIVIQGTFQVERILELSGASAVLNIVDLTAHDPSARPVLTRIATGRHHPSKLRPSPERLAR